MGINSPKGPDDSQNDINLPELISLLRGKGYNVGDVFIADKKTLIREVLKRMAIDKADALLPEQIEGLPVDENTEQIIDSTRLNLCVENLDGQKPEAEKICVNSEIKEERTFSKKDILKLIALFAMANKLELNDLKVSNIIRNEQGVMLVLEVKSPGADGGYQVFNYTIKGRHESYQCRTTNLDRTLFDRDDMPEGGNTIADYLEGKWRLIS